MARRSLFALALATWGALTAKAVVGDQVVQNGCFAGVPAVRVGGLYSTYYLNQTIGCDWRVTSGAVILVGTGAVPVYYKAPAMACPCGLTLGLNADFEPGSIAQTLTTVPNNYYNLSMQVCSS